MVYYNGAMYRDGVTMSSYSARHCIVEHHLEEFAPEATEATTGPRKLQPTAAEPLAPPTEAIPYRQSLAYAPSESGASESGSGAVAGSRPPALEVASTPATRVAGRVA